MPRIVTRPLRFCIEFTATFAGVLIVLGLLVIWRLSMAPMSSEFLTPYIEKAIVSMVPGTQVSIGHSLLSWDNADRSITMHADGIRLTGQSGAPIAEVPALNIRVSVLGLLIGRLVPAGLNITHPQVWIDHDKNGNWLFGGMPAGGNGSASGSDIREVLKNITDNLLHAHFTRKLQVTDAAVVIHDEITGKDWTVSIPETVLEKHIVGTLSGEARIEATQGANTALIAAHYAFDPDTERHTLKASFSGLNPAKFFVGAGPKSAIVDLPLTGDISFAFDRAFELAGGALDIHGDEGALVYADFWDAPRAVKSLDIKGSYDRATGKLDVPAAVIDFGGPALTMTLAGAAPVPAQAGHDLDFTLSLKLAALPMNEFGKVWPKPVVPGARAWIAANLSKGSFTGGEAMFKGYLAWNDLDNLAITEGQGKVNAANATVKYIDGMPPVVGVGAAANFDLNQMSVTVTGGGIGDLKLQPSTIVLTDFEQHVQNINLPVHVTGPVPQVLKLIDQPPLGYAKAIGLDPDSVTGAFDGTVEMKFPLLNALLMKDINVKASATLADLASAKLLPGLDISQGDLTLDLDKTGFALKGTAALQKVPLQISWQEAFNESANKPLRQVSVTGTIAGAQWAQLGVDALAKSQGPVAVTLQMTQKTKKSTSYSGALDMKDAAMQVDELNWKKPAGQPASLTFAAEQPAGKDIAVKTIEADGAGLKAKGNAVLAADDFRPVAINLDPLVVGRTDAALHVAQAAGANGKMSFTVTGAAFDVSGFQSDHKAPAHPDLRPKEFNLKLGKLFTSDAGFIASAHGTATRDAEGWSAISLHGLADGGHQLDIDLTPKPDGHRDFSVSCDDFGKALKGLGITDTVKDGKLKITGASTPDHPRRIDGKVMIGHFQVKNLPALVVLMNATSPFNLVDLFTGTLDFDKLEGDFRWEGETLGLDGVRAAGNSVGMTIDGKLNLDTGDSDLHGTMAPFSLFNRIIGAIPLIGDMITGGEGQGVLGVTYTIKGSLDKPNVSVNPVSLLTPGFLRNLFFGGGDSDDDAAKPSTSTPAADKTLPPVQTNINKR